MLFTVLYVLINSLEFWKDEKVLMKCCDFIQHSTLYNYKRCHSGADDNYREQDDFPKQNHSNQNQNNK